MHLDIRAGHPYTYADNVSLSCRFVFMNKFLAATSIAIALAFFVYLAPAAEAQQAMQPGFSPTYQPVYQAGYQNGGMPNPPSMAASQGNLYVQQQPYQATQPIPQGAVPQRNAYDSSAMNSNAMSPYEQQELALKESRMLQELEEMKQRREMSEGFRTSDYSAGAAGTNDTMVEQGYAAETGKRGGKFMRALRGVGSVLRTSARVAGPAAASIGTSVGTAFLMRAAFGPPVYAVPPGGMVVVQGQ